MNVAGRQGAAPEPAAYDEQFPLRQRGRVSVPTCSPHKKAGAQLVFYTPYLFTIMDLLTAGSHENE